MTISTQLTSGRVPQLQGSTSTTSDQAHDNLKHVASKVSQANGGPVQGAVIQATASLIKSAATLPLVPDLQKAVATVRQGFKKEIGLEALLKMAPPLRDLVLTGLSDNELRTFEVALSKGTTLQDSNKIVFQKLKSQIDQAKQNHLLQEILTDHPTWRSQVEAWKGVSLEDKIWLLQLYELYNLNVKMFPTHSSVGSRLPSQLTPDLSKPDEINAALNKFKRLDWSGKQLEKCSETRRLLSSFLAFNLIRSKLKTPHDDSEGWEDFSLDDKLWLMTLYEWGDQDVPLDELELDYYRVKTREFFKRFGSEFTPSQSTPDLLKPDVKDKITAAFNNITELDWAGAIRKCPKAICLLSNLRILHFHGNQLKTPPDVSKNVNLQILTIRNSQLTAPPDVRKNVKLKILILDTNQLTTPPDVSKNVNLEHLSLKENQLTVPPDVSKNANLESLYLLDNQLTTPPDFSRNANLRHLILKKNPLTTQAKQALAKLKSERQIVLED